MRYRFIFHSFSTTDKNAYLVKFIGNKISCNDTLVDINSSNFHWLYSVRKKLGATGKIIAFEFEPSLYNKLDQLKRIFNWNNVHVELIRLYRSYGSTSKSKENNVKIKCAEGAVIVNINTLVNRNQPGKFCIPTLDSYFLKNDLKPRLIKINAEGNELQILRSSLQTLKNHRPCIVLKCDHRLSGKEVISDTFRFLTDIGYNGNFILDSLLIPLYNFDFNVYQNECNDFYCTEFIFE